MAVTERDVELFAARIRQHFPPEQRDAAYELAYEIARLVGPAVKRLTPDTTIDEIIGWMEGEKPFGTDSLDKVEWIMALEVEFEGGFALPDELAKHTDRTTFRDLVLVRVSSRNRANV